MAVTRIRDNIHMVRTSPLDSNMYIINLGALIIDTTTGYHKRSLMRDLSALNLDPEKILAIINTHSHYDHIGGNPLFRNAKVMMHENAEKNLKNSKERIPHERYFKSDTHSHEIHISLRDEDTIRAKGTRLVILHTPGHTDDSISVYLPDEKALFTGDSVPIRIDKKISCYIKSRESEKKSLEKLRSLEISILLPGHGDPVTDPQRIKELLDQ